jgi:NADPH2:quinone reductase
MKAIVVRALGEPDVLRVESVDDPVPAAGQVVVRVRAAGVNPVETYVRSGAYAKLPDLPYTPGSEGAGEILAVGDGVTDVFVGDRVFLSGSLTGTYAEQTVCRRDDVHRLPDGVDFAAGAALGVAAATAWRALFQRGRLQAGEIVLVHGASGGVGSAAVQLAAAAGAQVFGTAGSEAGLEVVRAAGAERAFSHRDSGYAEAIRVATGGRGVDLILEMLANVNLATDLTLLAPRGRVAVIGSRGPIEVNPRDAMMREADVRGVMLGLATPAERVEIFSALEAALAAGTLVPRIAGRFSLADAPAAHRAVLADGSAGKIVLEP